MHEPANTNTRLTPAPVDIAVAISRRAARAQRSLEDARRFYAENVSDDIAASSRASSVFAPAFAKPGEMERRAREEETLLKCSYFPVIVGVTAAVGAFFAAAAAIVAAFIAGVTP